MALNILPECFICHKDLFTVEAASILPCGHVFGNNCILTWIATCPTPNPSCPFCRFQLTYPNCGHTFTPKAVLPRGMNATNIKHGGNPPFNVVLMTGLVAIDEIVYPEELPPNCPTCDMERDPGGVLSLGNGFIDDLKQRIKSLKGETWARASDLQPLEEKLRMVKQKMRSYESRVFAEHHRERSFF